MSETPPHTPDRPDHTRSAIEERVQEQRRGETDPTQTVRQRIQQALADLDQLRLDGGMTETRLEAWDLLDDALAKLTEEYRHG